MFVSSVSFLNIRLELTIIFGFSFSLPRPHISILRSQVSSESFSDATSPSYAHFAIFYGKIDSFGLECTQNTSGTFNDMQEVFNKIFSTIEFWAEQKKGANKFGTCAHVDLHEDLGLSSIRIRMPRIREIALRPSFLNILKLYSRSEFIMGLGVLIGLLVPIYVSVPLVLFMVLLSILITCLII